MTVEFPTPAPAASAQPGYPAPQTTYPVYEPTPAHDLSSAHGRMAASMQPPAEPNPLGEYHKVAQKEPGNERELLFTIGGKPLYAPHEDDIDPAIGFRMIRDLRRHGVAYATMNAFGDLLGDEALDTLADAPRMSKEEWSKIMAVLQDKVFSRLQENMPGGKD